MSFHITVEEVPRVYANVAGIQQISRKLSESDGRVHNAAVTIVNSWRSIHHRFEAPFSGSLSAVIQPFDATTQHFSTAVVMFTQATNDFTSELGYLLNRRGRLLSEVEEFVRDVQKYQRNYPDESWEHNKNLVDENAALRHRCKTLEHDASELEERFCRKLSQIPHESEITSGMNGATGLFACGAALLPNWANREASFDRALGNAARYQLNHISSLSEAALAQWVAANPDQLHELLDSADPSIVTSWWEKISRDPAVVATLIAAAPLLMGGLDGLPPRVRVAANANVAKARLEAAKNELDDLVCTNEQEPHYLSASEAEALKAEIAYLNRAVAGTVQLYLYDPNRDRIIEMIGNPDTAERRLTWVPGTVSTLDGFYDGTLTGLPDEIASLDTNALVFVVKDGTFPQLDPAHPATLSPANTELMNELGSRVARFEAGMDASGYAGMTTVTVGHSAGLAIAAAAETHGATSDTLISLSGAGMSSNWLANPDTRYVDLTPDEDVIRVTRATASAAGTFTDGFMGYPQVPERDFGFVEIDPELGRDTDPQDLATALKHGVKLRDESSPTALVDNHNQITSLETTDVVKDAILNALRNKPVEGRVRQ